MKNNIITEFINGQSCRAYEALGAVKIENGIRFSTYAPHARKVELCLNGDIIPMECDERGVWSVERPAKEGDIYQYVITTPTLEKHYRSDPFAVYSEVRPKNASVVYDINSYSWNDQEWLSKRDKCYEKPMNIYEVHFGSWRIKEGKEETDRFYTYEEMIDLLIPYVKEMGYTHIELLPLTEYPYDGSWGYQVSGYFSATSRYGDPRGLMKFIDACHAENIGIILDFVPVHFVRDFYALHIYDGSFLFESDNEYDRYSEWGTALFDYTKPHVLSFVKSSVNFWIEKYHVDGLRYDAVANLIYRHGHTDDAVNDSGIWFLKNTNYTIQKMHPDVMLFAEDSTNYTKVTAPVEFGGLGFDYKWDLGFMNDTINYIKTPPFERRNHHNKMTFSMSYFYNDLFILPYSHDEVVHGKKTMVDKVFGSQQEQFATIRALYTFQFTHPGKKLNFMGNELGHFREWDEKRELDWDLLKYPFHDAFQKYFARLSLVYATEPALFDGEYNPDCFEWVASESCTEGVYAWLRKGRGQNLLCIMNTQDHAHKKFPLYLKFPCSAELVLDTEAAEWGGAHKGRRKLHFHTTDGGVYGRDYTLTVDLPAMGSFLLRLTPEAPNPDAARISANKAMAQKRRTARAKNSSK